MTGMNDSRQNTLLLAVTSPLSWGFYKGLIGHLRQAGFSPVLVSSPGSCLEATSQQEGVPGIAVAMEREIAPLKDLVSLWKLYQAIRRIRPDVVDASTPKAGLLLSIAAWLVRVPCRIRSLYGLRLETTTGLKRSVLWLAEWTAAACSNRVFCISPSLRDCAVGLKVVSAEKAIVLEKGGFGVDVQHFAPRGSRSPETESLRRQLGFSPGTPVVGFVGRFVRDKGIRQLVQAFEKLRQIHPQLRLLLVGDFEEGDPVEPETRRYIESTAAISRSGFVSDTAPYYKLMDVMVLPTYREGFGQVALEAQASGVPVVTTTATGAIDSVINGVTGILVPVGDSDSLADAIGKLLVDQELRLRMGRAGRQWMKRDFRPDVIRDTRVRLYRELLAANLLAASRPWWKPAAKRSFDFFFSLVALVVLSPLLLLISLLVRLFLGPPILFRQRRPGLGGRPFTCLKFRTMTEARDANGQLLPDAARLTGFGKFLRTTSLDELPELVNVIRGEMSLVGPRPLLTQYMERYSPEQRRRHAVKPGITGWAQINGRNALDWTQKFALDLWYVDHQSFWLDLYILAKTAWQVLSCNGIALAGHATMPEFLGAMADSEEGKV
jgi:lipopolysaccharide/colanic/teichoic acid biosynthesis glycosyltransferase/glycosyltransferase involved in cell wall biosynthesis